MLFTIEEKQQISQPLVNIKLLKIEMTMTEVNGN
jgi:hypothetical protein